MVIFGNTPAFVGEALKRLISTNQTHTNYRHLICFPFSGSPNRVRENNFLDYRNMVMPHRLEHLKTRMQYVGLSADNPKMYTNTTHIIDVFASGSGPAYMLEQLLRDFKQKPYPLLHIICLNQINIEDDFDQRHASISDRSAQNEENCIFTFPSKSKPHFRIPVSIAYLEGNEQLDMIPDGWSVYPEYNACYWQECYDQDLLHQ